MSIFRNIMSRVFGRPAAAEVATSDTAATPSGLPPVATELPGADEAGRRGGASPGGIAQGGPPPVPGDAVAEPVDVEAVLSGLAARNPQKLDWRRSIVDLMKLLELDSSLAARKELAAELGYTGTPDGSAEMNMWLHRAVMRRLAENGGRVPDDLRD